METEIGEIRKGLDLQTQALMLARQREDRNHEAVILNNLADAYDQLAEPQKALDFYQQALELARGNPKKGGELPYLNNVGDMYRTLGDWEKALELFPARRRAQPLRRQTASLRGKILINLALAYRRHLGQIERPGPAGAGPGAGPGEQVPRRPDVRPDEPGGLELELKDSAGAVKHAREAVALEGSPDRETLSRYTLGRALRELGDPTLGTGGARKSPCARPEARERPSEAEISLEIARVERDQRDPASALTRIQAAVELIESRREGVDQPGASDLFPGLQAGLLRASGRHLDGPSRGPGNRGLCGRRSAMSTSGHAPAASWRS